MPSPARLASERVRSSECWLINVLVSKTSDCPTCPVCEAERAPDEGFLAVLGAPARRALEGQGVTSPQLLARYSRREILDMHGMGPASMPRLERALAQAGLDFRED